MSKLKDKVFLVIFSLLTLFLITVLVIFNYQDYYTKKKNIIQNLTRAKNINNVENIFNIKKDNKFNNKSSTIFMDYNIYTVILNRNNDIICIINNSSIELNDHKILDIANNIIRNNNKSKIEVRSLYFNDYAYSYKYANYITIMNIENIKNELQTKLKLSLTIFIVLEFIIFLIAKKITKWITIPALESFDKQKKFIEDASHELKTPLSVIMASCDMLENNLNEKKWLNNIKNESDRMNNLIKSLLDLAKIENNSNVICSKCNISKLVLLQTLTYESLMFEQNIKLKTDIEEEKHIICNEQQIKQLVSILLDNAIKHSFKNEIIIVSLKELKNSVILKVKNKGDKIPKGEEEKIFERFYRLDKSRNRNDNRYGLGLAIAKNIANSNNATINAYTKNDYTIFRVVFKKNL